MDPEFDAKLALDPQCELTRRSRRVQDNLATDRNDVVWQLLAGAAVCCLVIMTAILVKREFWGVGRTRSTATSGTQTLVEVRDWDRVASVGHGIGPEDAPVTVVVFSDFECPFCARFATQTLPALRRHFPREMKVLFRHWPLTAHRNAYDAARAAECAAAQGRFEPFHDILFAQRDSLGIKSWVALAEQAGVPILWSFEQCMEKRGPVPAIERDIAEVRRIGGTGTPTIVINGMMMRPPYSAGDIATRIERALEEARN